MPKASSRSMDLSKIREPLGRAAVVETSLLAAPPAAVWTRIASMTGVNAELMPFVRMTFPRGHERIDVGSADAGNPLFGSVLLLFGVLPIDIHWVTLADLNPCASFLECSSSLLHRRWVHERRLEAEGGSTRIRDRVHFECRVPILGRALRPIVRAIFSHRHAQLRRHFGSP
jgi:ligand-binding SRPBCC domain-containing protein